MEKKRPSYSRPWFWLFIILVLSALFRLVTKDEISTPVENYILPVKEISEQDKEEEDKRSDTDIEIYDSAVKSKFHFILNKSTKKYHTQECSAARKLSESKREDTEIEAATQEEARQILEQDGYELCGICAKQVQE